MEPLNYKTPDRLGCDGCLLKEASEKVLQFVEGSFHAFVNCWFDVSSEKVERAGKDV